MLNFKVGLISYNFCRGICPGEVLHMFICRARNSISNGVSYVAHLLEFILPYDIFVVLSNTHCKYTECCISV